MSENKNQETLQEEESLQQEQQEAADMSDQGDQKEVLLWKDQCKRISAEFENFKKRTERDQSRWAQSAKEMILVDLLTFVDDFDRALKQETADNSGIKMMHQSLMKLLEKHSVKKIDSYESFDPNFHEAVMQVASDDHESGQIVEVFSNGFMIQERVLRPAKVSVAQ